jgi:hypothetical protein
MKLILAVPTYGAIDPKPSRYLRSAIMHAARNGHEWIGDASPDKEGFSHARNHTVKDVLEAQDKEPTLYENAAIVWIDSDIVLPVHGITTLASRAEEKDWDFITGIYFQGGTENWPLICHFNGKSFQWVVKWESNTTIPLDGCGFGCVLTTLRMLRKMKHPCFDYKEFSEDFHFCLEAKKEGFQLWCDTSVLCGHSKEPQVITIDDFKKKHPECFNDGGKENGGIRSSDAA